MQGFVQPLGISCRSVPLARRRPSVLAHPGAGMVLPVAPRLPSRCVAVNSHALSARVTKQPNLKEWNMRIACIARVVSIGIDPGTCRSGLRRRQRRPDAARRISPRWWCRKARARAGTSTSRPMATSISPVATGSPRCATPMATARPTSSRPSATSKAPRCASSRTGCTFPTTWACTAIRSRRASWLPPDRGRPWSANFRRSASTRTRPLRSIRKARCM